MLFCVIFRHSKSGTCSHCKGATGIFVRHYYQTSQYPRFRTSVTAINLWFKILKTSTLHFLLKQKFFRIRWHCCWVQVCQKILQHYEKPLTKQTYQKSCSTFNKNLSSFMHSKLAPKIRSTRVGLKVKLSSLILLGGNMKYSFGHMAALLCSHTPSAHPARLGLWCCTVVGGKMWPGYLLIHQQFFKQQDCSPA